MSPPDNEHIGMMPINNDISPVVVEAKQLAPAAKPSTAEPTQPQFKIVRVRKPDGTIVKVKRPITAEGKLNRDACTVLPLTSLRSCKIDRSYCEAQTLCSC
jgi:hypothetical protein